MPAHHFDHQNDLGLECVQIALCLESFQSGDGPEEVAAVREQQRREHPEEGVQVGDEHH